jgi:hypothetical protein
MRAEPWLDELTTASIAELHFSVVFRSQLALSHHQFAASNSSKGESSGKAAIATPKPVKAIGSHLGVDFWADNRGFP